MTTPTEIRPQKGPQEQFLKSKAFFTLYGGARGGGKTFALTVDPLRHVGKQRFRCKIFRKHLSDLKDTGGVFEEANGIYPHVRSDCIPNLSDPSFKFTETEAQISFGHFQDDRAAAQVQGKQFDRVGVDELAQLELKNLLDIIQSTRAGPSGVKPRLRATCNPPGSRDHWLVQFVEPYLTQDGYADRSQSGVVRWFRMEDNRVVWVPEGSTGAVSFAFVPALLDDNQILMERDPEYMARLMMLPSWKREQMIHGNWYAQPVSGMFSRDQVKMIDAIPEGLKLVRYWDQAGTEPSPKNPNPDYTAGALVGLWEERNALVIVDMRHFRAGPAEKRERMRNTALQDGVAVPIAVEQEPAASGKDVVQRLQTEDLRGFEVHIDRPTGDKATRAGPWLAWLETGSIYCVRGPWNGAFFEEMEAWPAKKKDQIDAISGAFNHLTDPSKRFEILIQYV